MTEETRKKVKIYGIGGIIILILLLLGFGSFAFIKGQEKAKDEIAKIVNDHFAAEATAQTKRDWAIVKGIGNAVSTAESKHPFPSSDQFTHNVEVDEATLETVGKNVGAKTAGLVNSNLGKKIDELGTKIDNLDFKPVIKNSTTTIYSGPDTATAAAINLLAKKIDLSQSTIDVIVKHQVTAEGQQIKTAASACTNGTSYPVIVLQELGNWGMIMDAQDMVRYMAASTPKAKAALVDEFETEDLPQGHAFTIKACLPYTKYYLAVGNKLPGKEKPDLFISKGILRTKVVIAFPYVMDKTIPPDVIEPGTEQVMKIGGQYFIEGGD